MNKPKKIIVGLISLWMTSFLFYLNYSEFSLMPFSWTINTMPKPYINEQKFDLYYNESDEFLINTPGCFIPNYTKELKFIEGIDTNSTCGQRAIFVEKLYDDKIVFKIDEEKMVNHSGQTMQCCYSYAIRSVVPTHEDTSVTYTPCEVFKHGTQVKLKHEVITVTCKVLASESKQKTIYEDAYLILKKKMAHVKQNTSWNVLLLGMDTMSRARVASTMPKTVHYLQKHRWLDYRGYHKIAVNTFPNLMALLAGKTMSSSCSQNMHNCNNLFMWSKFRDAGFITAYGEDFLRLPDTFARYNGFKIPPTDHYTRPFFLTGEKQTGNLICAKNRPSALNLLDYASQFTTAYKMNNFFGFFWLNSYSHNLDNIPALLENNLIEFFENLNSTGVLKNTFVFFFSDHGIRYGKTRLSMQSYYEERLPMLYMWVPVAFRKSDKVSYHNLKVNQYRLTTPYDLHATLWAILKMSNQSVDVISPQACPQCHSLFKQKSIDTKCADTGVDDKWCSCHSLAEAHQNESGANLSLTLAVSYIQNKSNSVETKACMKCHPLKLKTVLRIHSYSNEYNNKKYYIVAFLMTPGDIAFEATVEDDDNNFKILPPTDTISKYNTEGNCVVYKYDRAYCICKKQVKCNKKLKTYIYFRFILKYNSSYATK